MERTNKVYIVGTLLDVKDIREGEKDGKKWIAGTAVIQTKGSEIEAKFFSSEKTKDLKPNVRYDNYLNISKRIGERVKVNGEISGRVFFNESQGQVINFNEVSAGFFNPAKASDEDVATFEFGGFVVKPLHERLNKEEKLIAHEIELAQANYNGNNMQVIRFTVDKGANKIINAISNSYGKDATVFISGEIVYEVTTEEKTEEVAFGDPIVKKYQNTRKSFVITGGKQPITDGTAYSRANIDALEASYRDYLAEMEREAKERNVAGGSVVTNKPAASDITDRLL